jgi:repressor LexA
MKLTDKQTAVFKFILHFQNVFSYMPSTRDIQDKFGFNSQTSACNHLKALEKKGYIARPHKKSRAIQILKKLDA